MFGRTRKIRVDHIINGILHKKKLEDQGNKVIVKKGKGVRGDPNITATYDKNCLVYYHAHFPPFRKLKPKLILYDDNSSCVSFEKKKVMTGKPDPRGFFEAGAVKNAGATLQTVKAPTLLYVAIFALLFIQVLTLLFVTGKVRIV